RRGADDPQDLRRRSLLLQRLGKLARARGKLIFQLAHTGLQVLVRSRPRAGSLFRARARTAAWRSAFRRFARQAQLLGTITCPEPIAPMEARQAKNKAKLSHPHATVCEATQSA